jgi:hypothetical protein
MPLDRHLEDIGAAVDAMRNCAAEAGRAADAFDITLIVMRKANLDPLKRYRDMAIERCLVGSSMPTNRTACGGISTYSENGCRP